MLKKLGEFFEGPSGQKSSARLLSVLSVVIVLAVWAFVSLRAMSLQNIPEMVVFFVLGINGAKVAQRWAEKPTAGVAEVTTETKTTATTAAPAAQPVGVR